MLLTIKFCCEWSCSPSNPFIHKTLFFVLKVKKEQLFPPLSHLQVDGYSPIC